MSVLDGWEELSRLAFEVLLVVALLIVIVLLTNHGTLSGPGMVNASWDSDLSGLRRGVVPVLSGMVTSPVGCSSRSMTPTLWCNDTLLLEQVQEKEVLRLGDLFVYVPGNDTGMTIVHRLVACADKACRLLVLKGDDNLFGELVNRSQITYHVVGVWYHE